LLSCCTMKSGWSNKWVVMLSVYDIAFLVYRCLLGKQYTSAQSQQWARMHLDIADAGMQDKLQPTEIEICC
jgi:hypothetical protein